MKRILLFAFIGVVAISCSKNSSVKYIVTGVSAGGFNVTYKISGETKTANAVNSGWSQSFDAESDDQVYLKALANGTNAQVTVEIQVDGSSFKKASGSGNQASATVEGTID